MHARIIYTGLTYSPEYHDTRTDIHTQHEKIHSAIISHAMLSWWAVGLTVPAILILG